MLTNVSELSLETARHCRERIVAWKLGGNPADSLVDIMLGRCPDIELRASAWIAYACNTILTILVLYLVTWRPQRSFRSGIRSG